VSERDELPEGMICFDNFVEQLQGLSIRQEGKSSCPLQPDGVMIYFVINKIAGE
jgi:hypothetical protein